MQTAPSLFSPVSAAVLRDLLAFADPPAVAALEATSGLFGGGAPLLVELAVCDALGAAGLPLRLADARLAGEPWAGLLRFVLKMRVASAQQRYTTISAGTHHSLVVKDGALFSFGRGQCGQLGHGDTANQPRPKLLVALAKRRVVGLTAGSVHSLAMTADCRAARPLRRAPAS